MKKSGRQKRTKEYTLRNRVKLVKGGLEYFTILKGLIENATTCIYLQYYIFDDDETGELISAALRQAVKRGVSVFLYVDGYASQNLSKKFIKDLREAGIHFKWFAPFFKTPDFYFGRRLHHKVFVADGLFAVVGGLNICNRYNDMPGKPAWLDMAVYCEGEAAYNLHQLCRSMWGSKNIPYTITEDKIEMFCKQIPEKEFSSVRVRQNDWVKRKNEVWNSYLYMLRHAEEHVVIMCSYFIPGKSMRKAINNAVKRGVKIQIILAGPSDVMVAKHAERYLYDWLLKKNIEIYEYQETVLHAKVAEYDNRWVTIGSYNLNNISAYASLELNLDIRNRPFAQHVETVLKNIIQTGCKKITMENYVSSTHFFRRIWQKTCYNFINLVLNLFTFYFKQHE
jgi:cardiolipin synthase